MDLLKLEDGDKSSPEATILKSTQINVETFKGRVQLSGFVSSRADAQRAIQVTQGVAGVQSVIDSMKIR